MSNEGDEILQWIKDHWYVPVAAGVVIIAVAVLFVTCVCICCCRRRRRRPTDQERLVQDNRRSYGGTAADNTSMAAEPSVVDEMNRQRREQDRTERETARQAVDYHLRNTQKYTDISPLPDMGSRMQKYWFKVQPKDADDEVLLTIAPVSQRCPIKLDQSNMRTINNIVESLKDHPYLHPVLDMSYHGDRRQVIICQPLMPRGSLKDAIYRATPTSDWSQKYSRRSRGLSPEKVALYGRQILEAMVFLDSKGFPPLGHVQSGNCFVKDNVCQLSGYENTLLGYKTRLYRIVKDHMDQIDIIMFGHLIFEMSCGYELTSLAPTPNDYKAVKSDSVRTILMFMFEEGFPHDIDEIVDHAFFKDVPDKHLRPFNNDDIKLSSDMRSLLKTVTKGKPIQKQPKAKKTKTPTIPSTKKSSVAGPTLLVEDNTSSEPASGSRKKPVAAPRKKQDSSTST